MDTFLSNMSNGPFLVMQDNFDSLDDYLLEKASMWLVEGDIVRPSTNISIQNKLNPGIYTVSVNRDYGVFCKKLSTTSDGLITFSNSIILDLINEINLFWDKKELYSANNLIHKRGILLEGFPGTGKTSIISLLAEEVIKRNGIVFKVSSPSNLVTYIDFIQNSLRVIEPNTPIITIIEDLEKYQDEDTLLDFLDGKANINHHVIITTTNNTQQIEDAFLRPSRIDLRVEVPLPCSQVRREYFVNKNVPESDLDNLIEKSHNLSLADLKELYITAYMLGYGIDKAIEKTTKIKSKKNFSSKSLIMNKLGL